MPTAFVRVTEGNSTGATLTLNIQSDGANRVLVVGLAYKSNSPLTPTSIVFNTSENFALEKVGTDAANAQCFIYHLIAPSVVTADVVITMPSAVRMVGYVALFTGIDQTNPFTANTVDAQGADAAPTVTVTSATDEICVDILAQVSAGPHTATLSHTLLANGAATGGGTDTRGAGQYVAGVASRVMDYSMSGTDDWNIVAGGLQPASANVLVTPDTIALVITTFIPTVTATANQLVTPDTLAHTITAYIPTVTATDNKVVTPDTLAHTLTTYIPTISVSDNKIVTPDVTNIRICWRRARHCHCPHA